MSAAPKAAAAVAKAATLPFTGSNTLLTTAIGLALLALGGFILRARRLLA